MLSTILFTDIVRSSQVIQHLGDDRAHELFRAHRELLRQEIRAHGGEELKWLGDGAMAAFPSAASAVQCAVALQETVERQICDAGMRIRIGMNAGEVIRDDGVNGADYFGSAVVAARRLCDRAEPGTILCSATVAGLLSGHREFHFRDVGRVQLKGEPEPIGVCEVLHAETSTLIVRDAPPECDDAALPLPPLLVGSGQLPLAGRGSELDLLRTTWRSALLSRQVVLLSGEPGIGKTRLAAEIACAAHASGGSVLYGRCDEGISVPFQPFVEALQYFVDHHRDGSLRERLGRHAGELVRLVPDVALRVSGLPSPLASDPATERYRLFDAVVEWLRAASVVRPLLLVLDDLHWADPATLLLVRHVARAATEGRLAIVGTHRDTEIDREHPLTKLLADLCTMRGVVMLPLRGLDQAAGLELFEHASGERLDDERRRLAEAIHAEAAGNPFFVAEMVRSLTESGILRNVERPRGESLAAAALSAPVRDVVLRRVARLSPAAGETLTLAAVIGVDFELATLAAVSRLDELTLIGILEDAATARLVEETAIDRYRFAHALVRSALYATLSASHRARLHGQIAATLESTRPDDVAALARHFTAAGRAAVAKAIEFTIAAGDRAIERLAHDQAVEYYGQALAMMDAGADARARCDVLSRLGTAQKCAGHRAHRETLLAAARLAMDLGDTARVVHAALTNNRGWVSATGAVDADRVSVLEGALATLPAGDSTMRARLLATLGAELVFAADRQRRLALSDEALVMARRLDDPATLAHVLNTRAHTIWSPDTLAERLANSAEHVAVAERLSDPLPRWYAAATRPQVCMEAGDIAEVDRQLAILAALTKELNQPHLRWAETINRSWRALLAGRLAQAEAIATEAYHIGTAAGQADALMYYSGQLFAVRFEQGRLHELLPLLERARERPRLPAFRGSLTLAYLESERLDDARALLDQAGETAFALPLDMAWTTAIVAYAEAAARLRATGAARVLYELLLPWADQVAFNCLYAFGSVARSLGLLAAALDDLDRADAWFERAAVKHEHMHLPAFTRTQVDWAEALLRRGRADDTRRAQRLLAHALPVARQLGLAAVAVRAERLSA